jgi:ABC-type transport system involved in multi-copper enzyme maturation permease subunit
MGVAPMRKISPPDQLIERTLALSLFVILIFSTPVMMWWTSPGQLWFLPYLLWLGVILAIAWMNQRHDDS